MTASSTYFRRSSRWEAISEPIVILNILLLCLCAVGLAVYIGGVNSIASREYHISSLRGRVAQLTEEQGKLTLEKSSAENPAAAALFAQAQHMVSAQDIFYVFENGNVALQR